MLSADEVNIIKGALDMTHKIAKAAMTPMDMVRAVLRCAVLRALPFGRLPPWRGRAGFFDGGGGVGGWGGGDA